MSLHEILEPENDYLLVKLDPASKKVGEIILPDSSAERSMSGVILKSGEGAPSVYKGGVRVLFGKFAGMRLAQEGSGDEVLLMAPSEIMGIMDGRENVPAN